MINSVSKLLKKKKKSETSMAGSVSKLLKKKKGSQDKANQEDHPNTKKEEPVSSTSSRYSEQWTELSNLFQKFKFLPWDAKIETTLKKLLDSLQSQYLNTAVAESFSEDELNEVYQQTKNVYALMGDINRKRVQSVTDLASDEMKQVLYESILLFEVNPTTEPPLELSETEGFDEQGNPIVEQHIYPLFQEKALAGIRDIDFFFSADFQTKMNLHLQQEMSTLVPLIKTKREPSIVGVSTIGSLGGIGHKRSSDLDIQVICNTNPKYSARWNDADYFLALLARVTSSALEDFYQRVLSSEVRTALYQKIEKAMQDEFGAHLQPDESEMITAIFPSTFAVKLEKELWVHFHRMNTNQKHSFLWKHLSKELQKNPSFEFFKKQLLTFFPFLQSLSAEKLNTSCFPFLIQQLKRDQILHWLFIFYKNKYLLKTEVEEILLNAAKKAGVDPKKMNIEFQKKILLNHLIKQKNRNLLIEQFTEYIAKNIGIDSREKLSQVIEVLRRQFDPRETFLSTEHLQAMQRQTNRAFRKSLSELSNDYMEKVAIQKEALIEFPTFRKVQLAEQYLLRKYPTIETHFFLNILRKQRAGKHTPFLISAEGSLAYALVLNDSLLNPAVILAGRSPIPFAVPKDIKLFHKTGAFSEKKWTLEQARLDENMDRLELDDIPDWGSFEITREQFWTHAIPIFYRESEKVSHRNLPKALLNCWWIEMICCLEKDEDPPTSLTHLLFQPEQRQFLKEKSDSHWSKKIQEMEENFPELVRDPWWIKFTEMLTRFNNAIIQKQMIFCFAQHINLLEIIDFTNEAKPIWIGRKANWRTQALIQFYDLFIPLQEDRTELMRFASGMDDVANQVEGQLKRTFVLSLHKVERKLLSVSNQRIADKIMGYLERLGIDEATLIEVKKASENKLAELNRQLFITDDSVLAKAKSRQELSKIEQSQIKEIQKERENFRKIVKELTLYYQSFDVTVNPKTIHFCILEGRLKIAGNPQENSIFKYHFERNFKNKPYQVPFPISKSLSFPRKLIMIEFIHDLTKWKFQSVLSKKETQKVGKNVQENRIEMFSEKMVEGLCRCVFSEYIGYKNWNLTSFQKLPTSNTKAIEATNSFTSQEMQELIFTIHDFFLPMTIRPKELLEDIYYIKEILMVGCVNYLGNISLIVRDNYGDCFVAGYNCSKINIKVPETQLVGSDQKFSKFLLQFNSKESRQLFQETLNQLNIPLSLDHPPQFRVWLNPNNFQIPTSRKLTRIYADGIANSLWTEESIRNQTFHKPTRFETLNSLGNLAIDQHRKLEAEKEKVFQSVRQKNERKAREYMNNRRKELDI